LNYPSKQSYFSLLEIIIVVLLLGIMSGYAMMRFDNHLPETRLQSTAKSLASLLQSAHSKVMSRGSIILLEIDRERNKFELIPFEGRMGKLNCEKDIGIFAIETKGEEIEEGDIFSYEFNPVMSNSSLLIKLINDDEQIVSVVFNAHLGIANIHKGNYEDQWLEDVPKF
jgi:type II secretory pathway pseudopilin PulG